MNRSVPFIWSIPTALSSAQFRSSSSCSPSPIHPFFLWCRNRSSSRTRNTADNEVAELFDKYNLVTLPVIDAHNKLVGVITSDDVITMLRPKL